MRASIIQFNQMHPQMRPAYLKFDDLMLKGGLWYSITSVARATKEQIALYAQGRHPLNEVNLYRKLAGLPPILQKDNKIVTWTLTSYHVIDLEDSIQWNNYSRAFDIVLYDEKKVISWNLKVDVDHDSLPDYKEAADIGKKCGLVPGYYFKTQDAPHYQFEVKV